MDAINGFSAVSWCRDGRAMRGGWGFAAVAVVACASSPPAPGWTDDEQDLGDASTASATSAAAPPILVAPPSQAPPDAALPIAVSMDAGAPVSLAFDSSVPPPACAAQTVTATPTPLDVFFLFDTSGSMNDLVGPGVSKWSAVTSAVHDFMEDPASAGIEVAATSFPALQAGVPQSCTSSTDCGAAGPCLLTMCNDGSGTFCATDADCAGGASCVTAGECSTDSNYLCDPTAGGPCGADPSGFDLGTCAAVTTATCAAADTCDPNQYSTPSVGLAALPDAASSLDAWLSMQTPAGSTPTPAALTGVLAAAQSQAAAHPDHDVVVVLATDGVPDETSDGTSEGCTSADTSNANAAAVAAAASALAGTPSVRTFAIGVFTPDAVSAGTESVQAIASAGGTAVAYVVGPSGGDGGAATEGQFEAALRAVRGASLPCKYAVPVPDAGIPDPNELNVTYTPAAGLPSTWPRVSSSTSCGSADGWFYEAGPGGAGAIDLCPATCSALAAAPGGEVEVVIGCETVVR